MALLRCGEDLQILCGAQILPHPGPLRRYVRESIERAPYRAINGITELKLILHPYN